MHSRCSRFCRVVTAFRCLCARLTGLRTRRLREPQLRGDDLGIQGIREAALASKDYYSRLSELEFYSLEGDTFSSEQMSRSVDHFLDILADTSPRRMDRRLADECRSYAPRSGAQYTAYFEPVLRGSLKRDDKFQYPLYERPDDSDAGPARQVLSRTTAERFTAP